MARYSVGVPEWMIEMDGVAAAGNEWRLAGMHRTGASTAAQERTANVMSLRIWRLKTLLRARDLTREICMFATYFAITVGENFILPKIQAYIRCLKLSHFHSKDVPACARAYR